MGLASFNNARRIAAEKAAAAAAEATEAEAPAAPEPQAPAAPEVSTVPTQEPPAPAQEAPAAPVFQIDGLTIPEVKEAIETGKLTKAEALTQETGPNGKNRATLIAELKA